MTDKTLHISTPSDLEIRVTRRFNAPRALVFDAHTIPELVKKWMLSFDGTVLAVCTIDLREGGSFRYEMELGGDHGRMGWGGTYRELRRPERIVHTELFDQDWTGGEVVVTLLLREIAPNETELDMTMLYVSKEARDGATATGMTDGMEFSYGHLDAFLASRSAV
jgi:uncharacterized protein YndB with AHSA1/START domain